MLDLPIIAYVLISAVAGKTFDVLEEVKKVEGVLEAHAVTGEYDIIAKVEASDLNNLGEKIVGKIHKITGVVKTVTAIAVK